MNNMFLDPLYHKRHAPQRDGKLIFVVEEFYSSINNVFSLFYRLWGRWQIECFEKMKL